MIVITDKTNDVIVALVISSEIVENGIKVKDKNNFEYILPDFGLFMIYENVTIPDSVTVQAYKYTVADGFVKNGGYVPYLTPEEKVKQLETELQNNKLAMAELVEQQQADKLSNQLALAEVIESIMGGTVA